MDVTGQMLQIFIRVYQHGFKPPLKQMTEASSFSIEIHGITDVDPFDRLTQVRMGRFYQKVIMGAHQAIAMHLDIIALYRLADILQKFSPVPLAPEYMQSRVSSIHHLIKSTRGSILKGRDIQPHLFASPKSIFFGFRRLSEQYDFVDI